MDWYRGDLVTADSPAQLLVAISVWLKCNYFRTSCIFMWFLLSVHRGEERGEYFYLFSALVPLLFVVLSCSLASAFVMFFFFFSPMSSSRGAVWFNRGDPESRLPWKLPEPPDVLLADQRREGLQHHFALWTLSNRKGVWHPGNIWWWVLGTWINCHFIVCTISISRYL